MKHNPRKMITYPLALTVAILCLLDFDVMASSKAPARVTITEVKSASAGKVKVSWKKVSKATKYQVQVATNQKFTKGKQTKTVSAKKTTFTFTKLKQGKKYYVRVRAYKTTQGKKSYGKWSKIKTIKVSAKTSNSGKTDLNDLDLKISLEKKSYDYTGKPIKPKVKVYNGSQVLAKNVDYKVTYEDNKNAGKATVKIKGIGKYEGTVTKQFKINKISQKLSADVTSNKMYIGKTQKIKISKAHGKLSFRTSRKGIVDISSDGTITAKSSGIVYIYLTASGDTNYEEETNYYVGWVTVVSEQASAYGFDISVCRPTDTYKTESVNSRNSDGSNTYVMEFNCDAEEEWLDENVTYEVEDVTPTAYANMFSDMRVGYVPPAITQITSNDEIYMMNMYGYCVRISEPHTENGPGAWDKIAISGKKITVQAGPSVRAIKVTAKSKKNGAVLDYIYVGSSGMDENENYSEYDRNLYERVKNRVLQKIWTNDMTRWEKVWRLGGYIESTTHYPRTVTVSKEHNPTFWKDWSVDDKGLFYDMFSDDVIETTMIFQGGITTCIAADLICSIAQEELGFTYLKDNKTGQIADGEGVWIATGADSTNPMVPTHVTLKYRDENGLEHILDCQGIGYTFTANSPKVTCEAHDCRSKIVSLK